MVAWTFQKSSFVAGISGGCLLITLFISVLTLSGKGSKPMLTLYISYPGGSYPENGVFNLLLYFSSIFGTILMLMRYVDVEARGQFRSVVVDNINKVSLLIGIVSMMAVAIMAAYPITSEKEVNKLNESGTCIFFLGGAIYCGIQTAFSFHFLRCSPCFITRLLIFITAVASIIASPAFIMLEGAGAINGTVVVSDNTTVAFSYSESSHQTQYIVYSAICQRIALLAFSLFQLSFIWEFKKISGYVIIRSDAIPSHNSSLGQAWVQAHKSWNISERF